MKEKAKNFRSSSSGYSFQDLYNEYNLISTVYLPSLYSLILTNHVTTDPELLISRYEYRKSQNDLALKNYKEALAVVESMLENYSEKNSEMMVYQQGGEDSNSGSTSPTILNSIIKPDNYSEDLNTYDSVLNRYIRIRSDIQQKEADNEYCEFVFSAFRVDESNTLVFSVNPIEIEQVESLIVFIESKLRTLDKLLNLTAAEHLNVETMKNIKVRSTVNVKETVNVKLYTVLIVAVFFIFGVLIAIVLGRSLDFVDYHFYTDTATGLPNHMKCDSEIGQYDKKTLPIPFTVVVIALSNMNEINAAVGRDGGNEVLRVLANMIKESAESFGFVAYNGSLNFMGLFAGCDETRATYFKNVLKRAVAEFNLAGHGVSIRYKISSSTATEHKSRTVRELISTSMSQLRLEKEVIAEE
jgi:GGDEF domain-containing protein